LRKSKNEEGRSMISLMSVLTLAGVVTCVVTALIAIFVLPSMAPLVFFAGCVLLLVLAFVQHWAEFGHEEYETNTLWYTIKNSASLIMVLLVILSVVGYYYFNHFNTEYVEPPMPNLTTPTMIGGGFNSVVKTALSRVKDFVHEL
jgi:hypothetical protein